MICIVGGEDPPEWARKKKKRRKADDIGASEFSATSVVGPSWAREVLGIENGGCGLTMRQLCKAYRRKALEVHPDKQVPQQSETTEMISLLDCGALNRGNIRPAE